MRKENQTILELCKFLNPDKDKLETLMNGPLDYPYILGQLLYNRMGAVGYYTLKQCNLLGQVNREFRNTLKAMVEVGAEKTNSLIQSLAELKPVFQGTSFPYTLLKGAYLANLYPEGLRTSNDIDVLVCQKDITQLSDALKRNGFQQGNIRNGSFVPATRAEIVSSRMNRGETIPFVKKVDLPKMEYLELDINFSLDFKATGNMNVVDSFLKHAEPLIQNTILTLSPVDFLIHLCVHLFKEATVINWVNMGRDLSLYKFCDIYLFVNQFMDENFCRKFIDAIVAYGLQKECYYALYHTKMLFHIDSRFLNEILSAVQPCKISFMKQIIDPQNNKIYAYDSEITEWIFCSNRKENIYEITNA